MIKNIIFDFGDIFIDLDKTASIKVMKSYGLDIDIISNEMDEINQSYEKGNISSQKFVSYYESLFPNITKKQLITVWNAIILYFPENRLKFIESLAKNKRYRLFLLSNTNELHIKKVIENMKLDRYNRFKKCFEKFYLSHEIHLRKPSIEIYEFVLKNNQLKATETLFVDDTEANTIAAASLGVKTWCLNPEKQDVIHLFDIKKNILSRFT